MNLESMERVVERLMTGVQTYVQNSFRLYEAKLAERFEVLLTEKWAAFDARVTARLAALRDGMDGKDAAPVDMSALHKFVLDAVDAQVRVLVLPTPEPGRDGKDAVITDEHIARAAELVRASLDLTPLVTAAVQKEVASIEVVVPEPIPGRDGKDAVITDEHIQRAVELVRASLGLEALVTAAVTKEVASIEVVVPEPIPGRDGKDGKDASLDDLRMLVEGEVAKAVLKMPLPRDGRDGVDGRSTSAEEIDAFVDARVREHFVRNPLHNGKDGKDGKDGRDGVSFDALEVTTFGDRTARFVFVGGDRSHSVDVQLPGIVDKGVYSDDLDAVKGDAVTWDGSLWIAQRASRSERPGTSDAWRLAVKHGRPGRDLTQPKEAARGPVALK